MSLVYHINCRAEPNNFVLFQRNWSEAFDYCKKNDMDLLNLETEKETNLIHNYIKTSGKLTNGFHYKTRC